MTSTLPTSARPRPGTACSATVEARPQAAARTPVGRKGPTAATGAKARLAMRTAWKPGCCWQLKIRAERFSAATPNYLESWKAVTDPAILRRLAPAQARRGALGRLCDVARLPGDRTPAGSPAMSAPSVFGLAREVPARRLAGNQVWTGALAGRRGVHRVRAGIRSGESPGPRLGAVRPRMTREGGPEPQPARRGRPAGTRQAMPAAQAGRSRGRHVLCSLAP